MLRLVIWIAAMVCGVSVGLASAWLLTGPLNFTSRQIRIGPWSTLENTGEATNNPYDRARVAIYGIWALPPSEVLYFTASEDDEGQAISHLCRYEISGGDMPARWWSVTIYRNFFWVPNPTNRYSWANTTVSRNDSNRWTIQLNAEGDGVNGLPMGREAGDFRLSLRLYHPHPGAIADRSSVPAPSIRRLSCAD